MSQQTDSLDRTPSLPFPQRLAWGRVIKSELHVLHFQLEDQPRELPEHLSPQWARVRKEDWPEDRSMADYTINSRHRLFLVRPTQEDSHLWHASLALGREDNPWNPESPQRLLRGDSVTGTVTRYVGDYAALVRLDGRGIEAFLHVSDTPDKSNNPKEKIVIQHSLHIGDRIQATIMVEGTDFERLRIWLSVNEALELAKAAFFERYREHQKIQSSTEDKQHQAWISSIVALEDPPFAGRRVLLVEHDTPYAKQLAALLSGMGAEVTLSTNPRHVDLLLKGSQPLTHILSDYQMGTDAQRKELFEVLKRSRLPVALMSGDYAEAAAAAAQQGWVMLGKPVTYADLRLWLLEGATPMPQPSGEDLSDVWDLGVEGKAYLRRAAPALAGFCRDTHVLAACWIRQPREGVYAALATHGLPQGIPEKVQANLGASLVANVIGNREAKRQLKEHAGPLRPLAQSLNAAEVWGIPLRDEGDDKNTPPDALLLFTRAAHPREAPLPPAWAAPLARLQERLLDLAEMTRLAERLREAESFATLGRVSGAVLHEIRQNLQGLETYLPLAVRHVRSGQLEQATADLQELALTKERITRLARANLYNLQKARRDEVVFQQRLPDILSWFDPAFQRHEWLLTCAMPDPTVTAWLPPEVVEQPLVNLLDNALHHLRDWGEVSVRLRWVPEDPARPIHIEVKDQGRGMTAEQLDRLFIPRVSSKGAKGYGLGLYTSRQLLRAVGGDLEVMREACFRWLGSGFRIRLPDRVIQTTIKEAP